MIANYSSHLGKREREIDRNESVGLMVWGSPNSACNKYCDPRELRLLDEVEYCLVRKNARLSADEIRKVDKGTIPIEVGHMTGHVNWFLLCDFLFWLSEGAW